MVSMQHRGWAVWASLYSVLCGIGMPSCLPCCSVILLLATLPVVRTKLLMLAAPFLKRWNYVRMPEQVMGGVGLGRRGCSWADGQASCLQSSDRSSTVDRLGQGQGGWQGL